MVGADGGSSTRFDSGSVSERAFSITTERRVGRGIVVVRGIDVAGSSVLISVVIVYVLRVVGLDGTSKSAKFVAKGERLTA